MLTSDFRFDGLSLERKEIGSANTFISGFQEIMFINVLINEIDDK